MTRHSSACARSELDVQIRLPVQQIDWIKANMPGTRDQVPLLGVEYLEVNHTRKPFDDIRVREAINLALNREAIAEQIRRAGDLPAYNLVPPGTANFPGGNAFAFRALTYPQRIERARALMRSAGYDEHRRTNITYMIRSTAPGNQRAVAAAIQQMLALVYINATILPIDMQVFLAEIHNHNFDVAQTAWNADFNDAATFLELLSTGGGNNDGLYSNRAFDAMMMAAQNDTDLVSRGRKLAAAEAIMLNDQAIMPLFFWSDEIWSGPMSKGLESQRHGQAPLPLDLDRPAGARQVVRMRAWAALLLLLAASSAQAESTLNRGNGAEPDSLDPAFASSAMEANILGDLMVGLTTLDAARPARPGNCRPLGDLA